MTYEEATSTALAILKRHAAGGVGANAARRVLEALIDPLGSIVRPWSAPGDGWMPAISGEELTSRCIEELRGVGVEFSLGEKTGVLTFGRDTLKHVDSFTRTLKRGRTAMTNAPSFRDFCWRAAVFGRLGISVADSNPLRNDLQDDVWNVGSDYLSIAVSGAISALNGVASRLGPLPECGLKLADLMATLCEVFRTCAEPVLQNERARAFDLASNDSLKALVAGLSWLDKSLAHQRSPASLREFRKELADNGISALVVRAARCRSMLVVGSSAVDGLSSVRKGIRSFEKELGRIETIERTLYRHGLLRGLDGCTRRRLFRIRAVRAIVSRLGVAEDLRLVATISAAMRGDQDRRLAAALDAAREAVCADLRTLVARLPLKEIELHENIELLGETDPEASLC